MQSPSSSVIPASVLHRPSVPATLYPIGEPMAVTLTAASAAIGGSIPASPGSRFHSASTVSLFLVETWQKQFPTRQLKSH